MHRTCYMYIICWSCSLSVELPMVLKMDNSGAVDIANSWSFGGRTRHVDVRNYFLQELNNQGLLMIKCIPGKEMIGTFSQRSNVSHFQLSCSPLHTKR